MKSLPASACRRSYFRHDDHTIQSSLRRIDLSSLRRRSDGGSKRLPIIDMHMHARSAGHYGTPPQPMCAEVTRMPLWDQTKSFGESLASQPGPPPCTLLMSPLTDEALLAETLAVIKRYKMIGMLGGYDPNLVTKWVNAAPDRFISGLDFRLDKATGTASSAESGKQFKTNHAGRDPEASSGRQVKGLCGDHKSIRRHSAGRSADGTVLGTGRRP